MTLFDIVVPVIALAVAGVGILALRHSEKSLDGNHSSRHPAE